MSETKTTDHKAAAMYRRLALGAADLFIDHLERIGRDFQRLANVINYPRHRARYESSISASLLTMVQTLNAVTPNSLAPSEYRKAHSLLVSGMERIVRAVNRCVLAANAGEWGAPIWKRSPVWILGGRRRIERALAMLEDPVDVALRDAPVVA